MARSTARPSTMFPIARTGPTNPITASLFDRGPINTEVIVQKCRFDEAGSAGKVRMLFDPALHRFNPLT